MCVNIYIYMQIYIQYVLTCPHTCIYIYIFHTHSSWCFCHLAEQGGGARQMVGRLEPGSCRGWWTVQCQFHASTHLCLLELHAACFLFSLPLLPQLYFTPQTHTHTHNPFSSETQPQVHLSLLAPPPPLHRLESDSTVA